MSLSLPQALLQRWRAKLQQDQRLFSILKGSATGVLARAVSMLVGLITLPLTLHYLGSEEYGIWVTVTGTVVMLNLVDLGIAGTLTNFLSQSFAEDDRAAARRYYSTAFWLTVAIISSLMLLMAALWPWIDWAKLLHISDPAMLQEAKRAIVVAIATSLLNLPLNLVSKVGGVYRELHVVNYFSVLGSLLSLSAVVIGVTLHVRFSMLMLLYCAGTVLSNLLVNVWMNLLRRPWLLPLPWYASWDRARELFSQGALFFILQLCGVVVFNSDNLVITHYLGAQQVTPYSVAFRLATYAYMLQQFLVPAAWPALSEAYRSRDMPWVRRTYRGLSRSLLVVGAASLVIGLFGRVIVSVWAGHEAMPPSSLLWAMAFWAVLVAATTNQALLLTAVGRLKLETTVAVLAAVTNLALSIFLVQRIGSIGVILATIASFAVMMLGPQQWEVRRVLRGDFLPAQEVRPNTVQVL